MSRLINFYRGAGHDDQGRSLAEMWAFSDEELESVHDFIQWMFPLREPSQYNPSAPLLTPADIEAFRTDAKLEEHLLQSFRVFLTFLGLRYDHDQVGKAEDFDDKSEVWSYPNHNWLRITRVLASLRLLGLEGPSKALFEFLEAYRDNGRSGITAETFRYWKYAANGKNGVA